MPRVSAIIPTFGRPALLAKAVDSVLAQTMTDLEVIVVIDGHDPATLAYLSDVADPRVRHIAHAAQRGPGQARNTGALAAESPWVAFLDDDDLWLPTKLEKQLALAGPRDAVVMTLSQVVSPDATFIRPAAPYDGVQPIDEWLFDRTTWLKGGMSFLQTSSLMLPRTLFDRLQFRDARQHEDWELVIEVVKTIGLPLLTVPEALTVHYWDHRRKTLSDERTWTGSLAWAEHMGARLTPRAFSGFLLTGIGQTTAARGEWSAFVPLLRRAFAQGSPTGQQLFRFVMGWATPTGLKRKVRAAWQGAPKDAPQ